jgi:hypothetical protein
MRSAASGYRMASFVLLRCRRGAGSLRGGAGWQCPRCLGITQAEIDAADAELLATEGKPSRVSSSPTCGTWLGHRRDQRRVRGGPLGAGPGYQPPSQILIEADGADMGRRAVEGPNR